MIQANHLKKGNFIELDNRLYSVLQHQHVKPGKGPAFVRTKLRLLSKGTTISKTFRSDEKLNEAIIEKINVQFLHRDHDEFIMMNLSTYEQMMIQASQIEDKIPYLEENMELEASLYGDEIISIMLPLSVERKIIFTEPGIKGDTVSGATKSAKIESNYSLQVPLFINQGDIIRIDTRTGNYLTRVELSKE